VSNDGRVIFSREDIDEVIEWVIKNYQQYKNKISWRIK
jgi:hypothetical protein